MADSTAMRRRTTRRRGAALAVLGSLVALAGCGARSELYDDEREAPGVPPTPPFATLPCRWTLGREAVVRELELEPSSLVAAVRGGRPEVLIVADGRGAVASVADPLVAIREIDLPPLEMALSAPDGWVVAHGAGAPACVLHLLDGETLSVRSEAIVQGGPQCVLSSRRSDALDVAVAGREGVRLSVVRVGDSLVEEAPATVELGLVENVVASRDASLGWVLATTTTDGALEAWRVAVGGAVSGPVSAAGGTLFAAPDRLRSGLALLRLDEGGRGFVERAPLQGALVIERVGELPEGAAFERGPMAITTNETEALVPLRDGRVAAIALNGIEPSFIGPVTEAREVHHVVVALETGTSLGGVAYTYRESAAGPVRVAFRRLTCNR